MATLPIYWEGFPYKGRPKATAPRCGTAASSMGPEIGEAEAGTKPQKVP